MTKTDAELVLDYADAAIDHGRSTTTDAERANASADTIATIYRELRRRGPESQAALLTLLDHLNPSVRSWAAAHALEFAPPRGEPVLEKLARGPHGVVRLDAEMTLQEWRKGRLRFP
jgi:hypothetical protein